MNPSTKPARYNTDKKSDCVFSSAENGVPKEHSVVKSLFSTGDSRQAPLWTEKDVAAFIRMDVGTIRRWRMLRTGPPYTKCGRSVRYNPEDVRTWVLSNRVTPE